IGKGGVGKTTISAAMAVASRLSDRKSRVLVCSTDPAPSLDDVFQAAINAKPRAVLRDRNLQALELDAVAEFGNWSAGVKANIESGMQSEARGVHLDLSFDRRVLLALLDVVPPGVDEIFATFKLLDLVAQS